MNHTHASQMKDKLEEMGVTFKKVDNLLWASYDGDHQLVMARTMGQCIWVTAKELGE